MDLSIPTHLELLQCNATFFDVVNDIREYPGYSIATITKELQIQVITEEIH